MANFIVTAFHPYLFSKARDWLLHLPEKKTSRSQGLKWQPSKLEFQIHFSVFNSGLWYRQGMTKEVQCHQTIKLRVEVARKMGTKDDQQGRKDTKMRIPAWEVGIHWDPAGTIQVAAWTGTTPHPALPVDLRMGSHHTILLHPWPHMVISTQCLFKPWTRKAQARHLLLAIPSSACPGSQCNCWGQENHKWQRLGYLWVSAENEVDIATY